ncbi:MAG: triple tyrosine motif-containing protein [Saprospiraceae bacterium]
MLSALSFIQSFHILLICILSVFLPFHLFCQPYRAISPQNEIYSLNLNAAENTGLLFNMVQDNDGYLWISTSKGLLVFDGKNSVTYTPGNPIFPIDGANDLSSDFDYLWKNHEGNIYANRAQYGDVVVIDPKRRKSIHQYSLPKNYFKYYPEVLDNETVLSLIIKTKSDSIFFYSTNMSGNSHLEFTMNKKDIGEVINYAFFQGIHWLQTNKGIYRIQDSGKVKDVYLTGGQGGHDWYAMNDTSDFYFFNEGNQAIMSWNVCEDSPRVYAPIPAYLQKKCNYFFIDHQKIYIAGGSNFCIIDTLTHTFEDISEQYFQLKANQLPGSLSEDLHGFKMVDGRMYLLGTKNVYALRNIPPPASRFKQSFPNKNTNVSMRGLAEDDHQNVYASYYSDIVVKSPHDDRFRPFKLLKNLNTNLYSAYNLTCHADHLFWHSLSIDLQSGVIKSIIPNVTNGHVVQMLTGDTLWMYTWYTDHFYKYAIASGRLDSIPIEQHQNLSPGFPLVINAMVQSDDPSAIWLATNSDGICLFRKNGKLIRSYSHASLEAGKEEGICDIYVHGSSIWYGCFDGLGVLNTKTGEHTLYKDPVIDANGKQHTRTVFSILPDEKSGFYLGTSNGLVYFDTLIPEYKHLDPVHPLAQNEYNRTSAFKDSRGRYYFGTTDGLFSFLPEELDFKPVSDSIRPIRLYSVSVFNDSEKKYRYLSSSISDLKKLALNPSETNIEFSFSVANFEKNIYYSYRVTGLNDKWSEYTSDHNVLLYSLPPGNYRLEIKASSNGSDDKASFYSLDIHMPAFWYRQVWVMVLFILLISGLITLGVRYRFQQKWKRQKELEKLRVHISSNLHDDVGSILSGLAMQSEMMSYEMEEKDRKPMLELSEMSREAMERMRDTVWAIDARKDKYENLIDRMRDFAEKNLERKNITHEFIVEDVEGKKFINPEMRQNIYLIFKEAITNIVKHSDAKHVKIIFSQSPELLRLVIYDNGSDKNVTKSDGSGLSNMKMRAEKLHGTFSMTYDEGFRVELKMNV